MKTNEITKNMEIHKKVNNGADQPDMWLEDTDNYKESATPHFRVKVSTLAQVGKIHLQFGCPDVEGLHKDMKRDIGSPFIHLTGHCLRPYGLAFDMMVKNGTIDHHQIQEIGIAAEKHGVRVDSLAQASDYTMMVYEGVVDGHIDSIERDGESVVTMQRMMLQFHVGEEKNKMFIPFDGIASIGNDVGVIVPEISPAWMLAWLCARYFEDKEEEVQ